MKTPTPRRAAFDALIQVESKDAYANLALGQVLGRAKLDAQAAATVTELVNGTARLQGTYDQVIARASGRPTNKLQPAVLVVLRLVSHELLSMSTAPHAAVDQGVQLAREVVGQRVTGLVNAVSRKIAARTLDEWLDLLAATQTPVQALATRTHHPAWIAAAHLDLLGEQEAAEALRSNNVAPVPTLVIRPGLITRTELQQQAPDATPTPYSPFGMAREGNPSDLRAVRQGRAGVQDEGSQLMAWMLANAPVSRSATQHPWLDLCAGPGGKAALLTGLAREQESWLLAAELAPHRAGLVGRNLGAYQDGWEVVAADGARPAWQPSSFARVMADVPCTGLGSLRRRPESRWRRTLGDLDDLVALQAHLLRSAWESVAPGGVVAYVTCSPHRRETIDQVQGFLAEHAGAELLDAPALIPDVPASAHPLEPRCVQLWPHRHGTDAMFGALLGKPE
ncbi:rRNA cytosine-C5-methylase [Aestuariimicrobium sp. p3-SID1156]|uniref:RsmB/NOP family class I SAM-dependent RNA methyltransferase n=1 Tax=Aestuariimicrobium sp. p3-SID1156 TaxID=2916038 RepID=UPI00223BDE5B|nr:transcription antitermination factor NusB [Aestuariimicrobium sp. p3-SID1156]MCT1460216.1 rRNA cytosine-C5-methylase [Aestuariimicrobium sp. p3-SID1156]